MANFIKRCERVLATAKRELALFAYALVGERLRYFRLLEERLLALPDPGGPDLDIVDSAHVVSNWKLKKNLRIELSMIRIPQEVSTIELSKDSIRTLFV